MRPFYLFLMKYRQPKEIDDIIKFANYAYEDHSFPKQSDDYHEVSSYLELNGDYLDSMTIFDQLWDQYVQIEEGLL
ncbi:YozE family protein [Peribacillus sp. NPDC097675]|uniref:YozE family protein n=1 Tax=Peribacillus sp. NPDC097675 TaxID=3390618 RepID=UPI003D06CC49